MTDRHATTGELLAARDGAASAWTREHLATCRTCSAEIFALDQMRARLRSLPSFAPPRDLWARIGRTAAQERRRRWWHGAVGLSAAAALTAITFMSVRPQTESYGAAEQTALERAMAQSRALEQTLATMQPDRRALPGMAAQVAGELESRLSRLDAQLAAPESWGGRPAQRLELWRERAGLMSALVDVHVTRAAAAGL